MDNRLKKPYLIKAPLDITFEKIESGSEREAILNNEFISLSEAEADPIGHWLKMKKAKGETEDSDDVLLELVVELHRKIDRLEKVIKGEDHKFIDLEESGYIEMISFSSLFFKEPTLEVGKIYYSRIGLKLYPERNIPIFFRASSEHLGEIERIHERDERDWNSYCRARERVMIREQRR